MANLEENLKYSEVRHSSKANIVPKSRENSLSRRDSAKSVHSVGKRRESGKLLGISTGKSYVMPPAMVNEKLEVPQSNKYQGTLKPAEQNKANSSTFNSKIYSALGLNEGRKSYENELSSTNLQCEREFPGNNTNVDAAVNHTSTEPNILYKNDGRRTTSGLSSLYMQPVAVAMGPTERVKTRLRAGGEEVDVLKMMNGPILKVDHSKPIPAKFDTSDDILDPFCDPSNPKLVSFKDVTTAAYMIEGELVRTPCTRCTTADKYGFDLYLKKELLQYTGSFKERGARYALQCLPPDQKARGVVTASWGNHAQGVSITGFKLNIPVTVVMPKAAPLLKVRKCLGFKARVVLDGNNISEAKATAMKMAKDEGLLYINGYDHPHIIAGQGTIGLEILDQVPNPDVVVMPVGGGSMISGVSTALRQLSPNTIVIGVESEMCPSFTHAILKSCPTFTQCGSTLADGLAVPKTGYNAYVTAVPNIDRMVVVNEKWIALGVLRLVEEEKCIVEGAGAASFAALISGLLDDLKGKKVVAVLSGGNIDTTVLERVLERGLASEGRLIKFTVCITDRPGGINELCDILKALGVAIKEIEHERAFLRDPYTVKLIVTCEARDWNHSVELKDCLEKTYKDVEFSQEPLIYEGRAPL